MEIVLLIIGIIIGTVVGYLAADRKSAALRAEISGTKKEIELLLNHIFSKGTVTLMRQSYI